MGLRQDGLGHQHCLCEYDDDDVGDGDDHDDDGVVVVLKETCRSG